MMILLAKIILFDKTSMKKILADSEIYKNRVFRL